LPQLAEKSLLCAGIPSPQQYLSAPNIPTLPPYTKDQEARPRGKLKWRSFLPDEDINSVTADRLNGALSIMLLSSTGMGRAMKLCSQSQSTSSILQSRLPDSYARRYHQRNLQRRKWTSPFLSPKLHEILHKGLQEQPRHQS
jgi:hypothetical protein